MFCAFFLVCLVMFSYGGIGVPFSSTSAISSSLGKNFSSWSSLVSTSPRRSKEASSPCVAWWILGTLLRAVPVLLLLVLLVAHIAEGGTLVDTNEMPRREPMASTQSSFPPALTISSPD
jgi:hypothetical protein